MLGGCNTNVPYKDDVYHVQTEDGGSKYPLLITHLYHQGAILASEKYNYAELLIEDGWKQKVAQIMKDQHKRVIKALLAGKYTGDEEEAAAAEEAPPDTDLPLEELILEYIIAPEG